MWVRTPDWDEHQWVGVCKRDMKRKRGVKREKGRNPREGKERSKGRPRAREFNLNTGWSTSRGL